MTASQGFHKIAGQYFSKSRSPHLHDEASRSRNLLTRLIIGGTTLIVSAAAYYSYQVVRSLLLDNLKQEAVLQVQKEVAELDSWLSDRKTQVELYSRSPLTRTMDWSQAGPYLTSEAELTRDFSHISLVKPDGYYYNTLEGSSKKNLLDRPHVQRGLRGQFTVTDPLLSRTTGKMHVIMAAPIWATPAATGKPIGVLTGAITVDRLTEQVNSLRYGAGSYAFALNSKGSVTVHPDKSLIATQDKPAFSFSEASDQNLRNLAAHMLSKQSNIDATFIDGKPVYVAYSPLSQANWAIALVIPRGEIESQLRPLDLIAIVVLALAGTLVGVLWYVQASEQSQLKRSKADAENAKQILEGHVVERTKELQTTLDRLQQSQLQLIQSEKMSTLGELVAGVAHEINNPVGFISGNLMPAQGYVQDLLNLVDLYQKKFPSPGSEIEAEIETIDLDYVREDLPKLMKSMKDGVARIKDISVSLRTFSRADNDRPTSFNIHEGIDSTLLILKHRLKAKDKRSEIKVIKEYGNLPIVECYAGQLNQVFMNLIANSIDALEEYDKIGSPEDIEKHTDQIIIKTELSENQQHAIIRIRDNGVGMTEEIKQRIFEQQFTTKEVGKGTGLGMAIAHQIIVEKHHGTITIDSAPQQGTEFMITIPIKAA